MFDLKIPNYILVLVQAKCCTGGYSYKLTFWVSFLRSKDRNFTKYKTTVCSTCKIKIRWGNKIFLPLPAPNVHEEIMLTENLF
jgi:hypothetical protein